jgi:hypothetical protein
VVVVVREGRRMAGRVLDRVDLAALHARGAGVIRVGRNVRYISARAVFGQDSPIAGVRVAPRSGLRGSEVQDRTRQQRAVRVVVERRAADRIFDLRR